MGIATLAGHRVTHGKTQFPKWGCWFADVRLDGAHELSGAVELRFSDLTLSCTILSGGVTLGTSFYRVVGGGGGWGRVLPEKHYVNDAGVRLRTVVEDLAREAGESFILATIDRDASLGPAWTRPAGPAARTLNHVAPESWYVGEDGITRYGTRAASTLPAGTTRTVQPDLSRGVLTLASETLASLLPGLVVDGREVVDVQHEISAKGGLRTTLWLAEGQSGGLSEGLAAFRDLLDVVDPARRFRGVVECRVVTQEGERLNVQPVRTSLGFPDMDLVVVRPGAPGIRAEAALGSTVLVGFVNSDPARPYVAAFEDAEGDGFIPETLTLQAGGMLGTEHIATVEGVSVLLHNVIVGLALAGLPVTWLGSGIITGIINVALAASNAPPAPPTAVAQIAAAAAQVSAMLTGPGTTSAPYKTAIDAALAAKTPNASGLFPSVGAAELKGG
jgi:hypothetical protein